jgi:hypothetical protein
MNKQILIIALAFLFLISCEDLQGPDQIVISGPEIIYKSEKLFFSTFPQSEERVKFLISGRIHQKTFNKLILLSTDSDTLVIVPLERAPFHVLDRIGEINYSFKNGEKYQLLVEERVNKDSINIYQLPDYNHEFKAKISNVPLAKFERFYDFDLTPDRDFLFLFDFENNIRANYRLQLSTGELIKLEGEIGRKLRAIDKNKFLHVNDGHYESEILLYDVEKKASIPFGVSSGNGGSITRVSNGHIVYANPVKDDNRTLTVVNLSNDERKVVPAFAYGYSIKENIIGQKIFGNSIFDIQNGTLSEELTPFIGTSLLQYNQEEDIVFFIQGLETEAYNEGYMPKFMVGKRGGQPLFDSGLEKNVQYHLPSETKIIDNKFLVYVQYGVNKDEHRVSGFYQVDLSNGSMELIQSESRPNLYVNGLVQKDNNSWLTIFSGGIDLLKIE